MSDNEIENAKKTMAQNINGLWLLNENKPSEVLNITLSDNKNIDDEIWLDIVGRLNDPKLKDYVRKYVGLKNSADGSATHTNPSETQIGPGLFSKKMMLFAMKYRFLLKKHVNLHNEFQFV